MNQWKWSMCHQVQCSQVLIFETPRQFSVSKCSAFCLSHSLDRKLNILLLLFDLDLLFLVLLLTWLFLLIDLPVLDPVNPAFWLLLSFQAFVQILCSTVGLLYPRVPHLQIQTTRDWKYFLKIPESSKKQNVATHWQLFPYHVHGIYNYLYNIYTVLYITGASEMI